MGNFASLLASTVLGDGSKTSDTAVASISSYREGINLYFQRDYRAAITKFTEAILLKTDMVEFFRCRSNCYKKINLLQEYVEDCEAILRLQGTCSSVPDHCQLLYGLLSLGELASAREALSRAQIFFPDDKDLERQCKQIAKAEGVRNLFRLAQQCYSSRTQAAEQHLLEQLRRLRDSSWSAWGLNGQSCSIENVGLCSHRHVENFGDKALGDTGAVFVCSSCHVVIAEEVHPDLVSREKESMKRLAEQDPSKPEDSVNRALSIGFILKFCEYFNLWDVSNRDVLFQYVIPMTSHLRCRFVDLPIFASSGAQVVGPADTFVTHCNKSKFGVLVGGLIDGVVDLNKKIWLDIFAVRQWPSVKHDLHFEKVIERSPSFMIVCPSVADVHDGVHDLFSLPVEIQATIPFFRVWCLYETAYAAFFGKTIVIKGGGCHLTRDSGEIVFVPNFEMLQKLSHHVDVRKASTTNESDKAFIFDTIKTLFGGLTEFNDRIHKIIQSGLKSDVLDHSY